MDYLIGLFERLGPYVYVPLLWIGAGAAMFAVTLWRLVTGCPRAGTAPDAPRLYDRVYYLLHLVHIAGWTGFPTAFLLETVPGTSVDSGVLILLLTAPLLVGFGLQMLLRGGMMYRAMDYLGKSGFVLWRPFYRIWTIRFAYPTPLARSLYSVIWLIAGVCAGGFSLAHLPASIEQSQIGSAAVLELFAAPVDRASP